MNPNSSRDTWIAQKIASDCEVLGVSTLLDEAKIAVGARFEKEIISALQSANELIVLVTPVALVITIPIARLVRGNHLKLWYLFVACFVARSVLPIGRDIDPEMLFYAGYLARWRA